MASNPERPDGSYETSPYGRVASELGLAAVRAVDDLSDEPDWRGGTRRRWLPSDLQSFDSTLEFAYLASEARGFLDLSVVDENGLRPEDQDGQTVGYNLDLFHTALPFSERERHWLIHTRYFETHGMYEKTPVGLIRQREAWGFDAGQTLKQSGGALLDAWWAWRRDIFEFENQGGLDYALAGLRGIGQILVPRMPKVASYEPMGVSLDKARPRRKVQREAGALTAARRQKTAS